MSIFCAIGGHEAAAGEVYNSGYWFSSCRRCGRDMIRTGASWEMVPQGHRVVWRPGSGCHSIATDFAHVLPVVHPAANLPMVPPRFISWNRMMVRSKKKTEPPKPGAPETEPHYPLLLVVAAVVGAGLQCLFAFGRRDERYS
jgi:hypothetical protein